MIASDSSPCRRLPSLTKLWGTVNNRLAHWHVALLNQPGRQGGFAVVDVGDNAKIADIFLVGHGHVLGNWMGWRKIFRVEPQSISKIRAEVYFCKP